MIYCFDDIQLRIARKVYDELQKHMDLGDIPKMAYLGRKLTTDIRDAREHSPFFAAHDAHQEYLDRNPSGYCNHKIRIKEWPSAPLPQ